MTHDPNNPRKLALALRLFERGAIGHRFSRPLTKSETSRLRALIESNGHGSCLFVEQKTSLAIGAWLCVCEKECELPLAVFAAEAKINVVAQQAGDKSFVLTGENTVQIQTQTIGVADEARALQTASIAQQVCAQLSAEIAAKVATKVASDVAAKISEDAQASVLGDLSNLADHAASDAAERRVVLHYEKPN